MGTDTHRITCSVDIKGSCPGDKTTYGVLLSSHLIVGASLRKCGAAPALPYVPS